MIELKGDRLRFSFPDVHRDAVLEIHFQRTLRIPDDGDVYPLPPGLGAFPLRHVDDFASRLPLKWLQRGGVMMPMYQSEAMWIYFSSPEDYPFAVKVGTGKIDAVTGDSWSDTLSRRPQNYLSIPSQPWLDGYAVGKGIIRQFVAMPLGSGYTAEEQITGNAEFGGLQLMVYPLKKELYRPQVYSACLASPMVCGEAAMGFAPGGQMKQDIARDPQKLADWDLEHSSRCFVHVMNSLTWRSVSGDEPPTTPPTSAEYNRAGLPWFDYYSDTPAVEGADRLQRLKSVAQMGKSKGDVPLPENESVTPETIVRLRSKLRRDQVREGSF